ncbi:hypothetical protein FBU30_000019 [Linnemannia zychae]|nr:hypothetical protein FBU30_000019 [Linnemannia zychae]
MTDAKKVNTSIQSLQEQKQQPQLQHALDQDHGQEHYQPQLQQETATVTLLFTQPYPGQEEPSQPQPSPGHQETSFRPHHSHDPSQPEAHVPQLVDDITRAYLLQEMTNGPTGVRQGSQMLLQQHATSVLSAEADDELNIYDYIYAKQEDEDDLEDHVVVSSTLSPTFAAQDLSTLSPVQTAASIVVSPTPSPSISASPSPSTSSVSQYDHATADIIGEDHSNPSLHASNIKTKDDNNDLGSNVLFGPVNYMDTTMEIYAPASLPNQELYRLFLGDLQVSAQREKYFSASAVNNPAIDSVSFLFNGQQGTSTPTNPNMQLMSETAASPSVFSTKPEPLLAIKSEYENEIGTTDPGPMSAAVEGAKATVSLYSSNSEMEDVFMETAEPEDDPISPGRSLSSPSSSGSITPELKSPLLLPAEAVSFPPSPRLEHTYSISGMKPPKLSKPASSDSSKPDRSISVSPSSTQLSIKSAIEQLNTKNKNAGTAGTKRASEASSRVGARSGSAKKRKVNRQVASISPSLSPIMTALPSPPASVKTTPPMHPSAIDIPSALEKIDLPPPSISVTVEPKSPISPTTPNSKQNMTMRVRRAGSSTDDDIIMESGPESTGGLTAKKKNANAKNKRPWTAEEEKLLLKMVDDQTPIKDIAETLDRSVHSVRSRRQVLTDPGFVKGNGHAQPRRSKPDPSSKLPTYSQMAFLSLARLPDLQGTLNDVASMVEKLFSRYLNRIPRTGHKNLQIWRAQISDALAHEKGHPRPRFESFGIKRGRQWVYRLTVFGKGVMEAMGGVDEICEDLLRNNETLAGGVDGEGAASGGAGAGLGQGNGYGYSYCPDAFTIKASAKDSLDGSSDLVVVKKEVVEDTSPEALAASAAIANAMAAMAAGMAAMTAAEDEKFATALSSSSIKTGSSATADVKNKEKHPDVTLPSGHRGRRLRA